jgi:FMN phosphatase YigB (HAD superfamily)
MSSLQTKNVLVFIDMDGVLVDLASGLKEKLNFELPASFASADKEKMNEMWQRVAIDHPTFWFDLKPLEHYKKLYAAILKICPFPVILSATPAPYKNNDHTNCVLQKRSWIVKHLGTNQQFRCIVTKSHLKHHMISQFNADQHVLIDDSPFNIHSWNNAGGTGILFKTIDAALNDIRNL